MMKYSLDHLCCVGVSMLISYAEGPGSIPGRVEFPGWGFSGFFLNRKTNVRKFGPQHPWKSPASFITEIIFITDQSYIYSRHLVHNNRTSLNNSTQAFGFQPKINSRYDQDVKASINNREEKKN